MQTRRKFLKQSSALATACALPAGLLQAFEPAELITRAIPKSGEKLPVVGLGSSATFRSVAQREDFAAVEDVLRTMVDNGGTVFDTAPAYGASEEVAGRIADETGLSEKLFWATKVNVAGRGNRSADPAAAQAQLARSFGYLGREPIDLIQVHNLGDLAVQVPLIQEQKQQGRIRYIGTTCTEIYRYGDLEKAMRDYPLDFIGVDYAVDNRSSAERVLPLAQELGIAVLAYVPFGRSSLFSRVRGIEVPEWAQEFGADTWGRFFIKYVVAHPAVTCVTPATSQASHMLDNMGAAYGELPDAATRRKMEQLIDGLPGG